MARAWWHVAAAVLLAVVVVPPPVAPCSCQLLHPQQHVCDADYVVFARVRRLTKTPGGHKAYKVRVKRLVKGSEKVEMMLQKGLLYTLPYTCEAGLLPRTSYVISGKVSAGKPMVTLCNFASPVRNLTPKMKKGFKLLYQSGCDCSIQPCNPYDRWCPRASFYCSWTTSFRQQDCQGRQSVCLRGPSGQCEWLQGRFYRRCMKTLRHNTTTPLPHRNSIRLGTATIPRRKISKFPYKWRPGLRRPGLRRRFRRPRPAIGYVPKKG